LAAAIEPTNADAWALAGAAYGSIGNQTEMKRCLDRSLAIAPNAPIPLTNRSLWYLLHGDYRQGWEEYRYRHMGGQRPRTITPEWNGNHTLGAPLLIWHEQG